MGIQNKALNQILEINRAFYDAFAAGDFLAVKQIWSKSHQISVIHPGSVALDGYNAVMMSWEFIFENSESHDIKCVDEKVYLLSESAYVVCKEVFPEGQLLATNIFIIEDGRWRMVHHQAGPTAGSGDGSFGNKNSNNESLKRASTSLH